MQNKSNKKIISLTLLTASALALGTAGLVVANNSSTTQQQNVLNTQNTLSLKGVTDNSNSQSLINPDEVFYLSEDLSTLDVWTAGSDISSGSENTTNSTKFNTLKSNLEKIKGNSTAKTTLLKICEDVSKYLEFKKVEKEFDGNSILKPLWSQLKQSILDDLGAVENFQDIPSISDTTPLLTEISGIASGSKIKEISYKQLQKFDLLTNQSNVNGGEGSNAVGNNFKQIIKIATIDLNTAGDYVLDFEYATSKSVRAAKSSLIIKNKDAQLKDMSIQDIKDNIDIFGRYKDMGTLDIGQSSYVKSQEGIVLSKKNGELSIFIRVDENSRFTNINFLNSDSYAQPTNFGILDVQASNNETFLDLINTSTTGYTKISTMVDTTNLTEVISKTQFFSDRISTTTSSSSDSGFSHVNRKLTFYQGKDQEFNMPLNYALASSSGNYYSYAPLTSWENGANTEIPISLLLTTTDGNQGTQFASSTYDFYKPLLAEMPTDVATQFPDITKIQLASTTSTQKITKQEISFSDKFYGIGNRTSWNNVDISSSYQIQILDFTAKIFAEEPESITLESTVAKSTFEAKEQADERAEIISVFGGIYQEWSKANSGVFNGKEYKFNQQIVQDSNGISTINSLISGSGNDIYNNINSYWNTVSQIMNKLFETGITYKQRYSISTTNSADAIVKNYFIKNNEYVSNQSYVEQILDESIKILKDNNIQSGTSISGMNSDVRDQLANNFLKIFAFQYETILNEFNSNKMNPIYKIFVQEFSNTTTQSVNVLKDVNDIFNLVSEQSKASLISYKDNAWNELTTQKDGTLRDVVDSIFTIMYYGSQTPNGVLIGDALFNSSNSNAAFRSFDKESILNFSDSNASSIKSSQIVVMANLLEFFGFNIEESINDMLSKKEQFKLNFNLTDAFNKIIDDLSSLTPTRSNELPNGGKSQSYYLDDLISGANAISALRFKLFELNSQKNTDSETKQELVDIISSILNNQQASSYELAIWSNIIIDTFEFGNSYSKDYSGRNGLEAQQTIYNKMIEDATLLRSRVINYNSALADIQKYMKYVWFTVVALIGAGVLVTSSVGIASKSKTIKLSSRPVLKTLLISGIILGLIVLGVALGFGMLALL